MTYTDWKRDNFFRALQALIGEESKGKRVAFEYDVLTVEHLNKLRKFMPNIEMVGLVDLFVFSIAFIFSSPCSSRTNVDLMKNKRIKLKKKANKTEKNKEKKV